MDLVQQENKMNLENLIQILQDKYLDFKLGEEQKTVLLQFFYILTNKKWSTLSISGAAGSGKSVLCKIITRFLEELSIPYILATPTHKAKGVLSIYTDRNVVTIHQLLQLRPTIDIMELDFKDLKFSSNTIDTDIPKNGVLIIDECSMINDVLYDYIIERAKDRNCKVLWQGDEKQLYPVKSNKLSKTFQTSNDFRLNKIYRQQNDNPLLNIINELREHSKLKFYNIISEQGSLICYNNWKKFVNNYIPLFKQAIKEQNPNLIKLLAFTNKRVEAFNKVIRDSVFSDNEEYHIGEILIGYDNAEYGKNNFLKSSIINSSEYIIKRITKCHQYIGFDNYEGYLLNLYSLELEDDFDVFILSRNVADEQLKVLAATIENIRLSAIQTKSKIQSNKIWREYFNLMSSFLTPIDLTFNGRIVRRKTLDYAYCMSVHKSQGSNLNTVLIDMDNILMCKHPELLRQLQYVALSRTKRDIGILIK